MERHRYRLLAGTCLLLLALSAHTRAEFIATTVETETRSSEECWAKPDEGEGVAGTTDPDLSTSSGIPPAEETTGPGAGSETGSGTAGCLHRGEGCLPIDWVCTMTPGSEVPEIPVDTTTGGEQVQQTLTSAATAPEPTAVVLIGLGTILVGAHRFCRRGRAALRSGAD